VRQAPALLDTDLLSALMRHEGVVASRAGAYLRIHGSLSFSVITKYEVLKGLKAKGAVRQIDAFDLFCGKCEIIPLDGVLAERASDIFADLTRRGEVIGDADVLIAATAMENGMGLVTNNEAHFRRVRGLRVENWLKK